MSDEPNAAPYGNSPKEIMRRRIKAFTDAILPASVCAAYDAAKVAGREQPEEIPPPIGKEAAE